MTNEADLEASIIANIDVVGPGDPAYWSGVYALMTDQDFGRQWAVLLSEEAVPPTTQDAVFRYVADRLAVTMGSVRAEFAQRLREINADEPETHGEWARWWLNGLGNNFAVEGSFWVYNDDERIFEALSVELAAAQISDQRGRNLTRRSDYMAVAGLAYSIRAAETVGVDPPIGIAVQNEFYSMTRAGVKTTELKMEHYARFKIDAKPKKKKGMFTKFIKESVDADQQQLLRQHFAAVLFGIQWKMQKCVLWYGPGATGKSTLQTILEAMVPNHLISSVSPADWEKEYHVAAMAGKVLNVVGEIEDRSSLGAMFKNVTGGGRINARHPTQQPFSYVSKAAQVFCSNYLPPSTDKSDAFWRRWSVVKFVNIVPEDKRDINLSTKIMEKEIGCVLAFALQGADEICKASTADYWNFKRSARQKTIEAQWVLEINSVAAFLEDDDCCVLGDGKVTGKALLFRAYTSWCLDNNQRPLGRNKFNREMVDNTGLKHGIVIGAADNKTKIWRGIGLLDERHREVF